MPRSLNRFQQLNAVTISGVAGLPLDDALKVLRDRGRRRSCPKGYTIDYTGESRQLRKEGGNAKFWPTMGLAVVLIFLVLAAQFNSFRDPLVILGGSVPLAMFGASIFMFLKFPAPERAFLHRRLDDDVQHLLAGRPGDARRAHRQERHPDRRVREQAAARGQAEARGRPRGRAHAAAARS